MSELKNENGIRQTLSFSKTDHYHQIVLKNFILDYDMNIFNTY